MGVCYPRPNTNPTQLLYQHTACHQFPYHRMPPPNERQHSNSSPVLLCPRGSHQASARGPLHRTPTLHHNTFACRLNRIFRNGNCGYLKCIPIVFMSDSRLVQITGHGLLCGDMNNPVLAEMEMSKRFVSKTSPGLGFLSAPSLEFDCHSFVP